jgi:hypothetical protein
MKRLVVLVVLGIGLLISGCGPDPRDKADAERTLALTAQEVADREQARKIRLAQEQAEAERRNRVADALTAGLVFGGGFAAACLVISAGIGGGIALVGAGQAAREMFLFRANWVPLDKATRQYPQIRQWVAEDGRKLTTFGKGVYMLANPNDQSVQGLDEKRNGDRQKIAAMTAAWSLGIVSTASSGASDSSSEGVAVIAPTAASIITASTKFIDIEKEV